MTVRVSKKSHVLKIRCSRSFGGKATCGRVVGSVLQVNGLLQLHWEPWSSEKCLKALEHMDYLRKRGSSIPDDWGEYEFVESLKPATDFSVVLRYQRTLAPHQLGSGLVEIPLKCDPPEFASVSERKLAHYWHERHRSVDTLLLT